VQGGVAGTVFAWIPRSGESREPLIPLEPLCLYRGC